MSELGDYKRAEAAAAKAGWERTLREWRCPDCGTGVTKVHMTIKGLQGCGKPPGYWAGRKGCEHDETLMGGECDCAPGGAEACAELDVWWCPDCGELQPQRGADAHCAGSLTEGTAHEDRPMVTARAALTRTDEVSDG